MKFLVTGYLPDDYDPSTEDESTGRAIHALNAEMEAAGALFFAAGLYPASMAKTAQRGEDGEVFITDGPYLETKEHVGGFLIIDAASEDEALEWVRKSASAMRKAVEVRQIFFQEE